MRRIADEFREKHTSGAKQAAEKLIPGRRKRQGTTLVVP
jgi:hypothetical protein